MLKADIRFLKLHEKAIAPSYGTDHAAGADLYLLSDTDVVIEPGETVLIHTGIALEIPDGYAGLIFARSGLATKRDLAPANKVGLIDSDYRGEIMIPLHNHGKTAQTLSYGERVAQIVFTSYLTACFLETDSLSDTERGKGGFGSTGV